MSKITKRTQKVYDMLEEIEQPCTPMDAIKPLNATCVLALMSNTQINK
jgi:hypothetical protein